MKIPKESKYIHLEYTAFTVAKKLPSLVVHFPYTRAQILLQLLNREIDKQELLEFVEKLNKHNVSIDCLTEFMLKACEKPQHILEVNRLISNISSMKGPYHASNLQLPTHP